LVCSCLRPTGRGRQGVSKDTIENTQEREQRDSPGNLSDLNLSELQQYLGDTNFPADKQQVASNAESNDAPHAVVAGIRNSSIERFDGLEEVLQMGRGN